MLSLCFSVVLLTLVHNCSTLSLISKSSIETCNDDGISDMKCTHKIFLAFTVQNAELANADSFEVVLKGISNTTSGEMNELENPIKITISKSPVYAIYPVVYKQDFNYHPKEKIISSDIITCEDGDLADNPTCEWQYDVYTGNKIPHSQGFCCKCNFGQIIGTSSSAKRGSQCKVLNLGVGSATAHCLIYDELWWGAYELQSPSFQYSITITIQNYTNKNSSESLILSPGDTITSSPDKNIIAKIVGDFLPTTLPLDYSGHYLLIPKYPSEHPIVQAQTKYWMIVKSDVFTFDGSECDKIGINHYAFRTQGDRCEVKVSTCLNNQIYDLLQSDRERISEGKKPLYLIDDSINTKLFFFASAEYDVLLGELMEGNVNTLITLELNADDVKFVINVSQGKIDFVKVNKFESMSNNGVMIVQITNIGEMTARFYISYYCTKGIVPIDGNELSLSPLQSKTLAENLYTTVNNETEHLCSVILKDSLGNITDQKQISFNSSELVSSNQQNTSNNNNSNETQSLNEKMDLTCSELCPELWDFLCFITHSCWWYLARAVLLILALGIIIIIIIVLLKKGIICKCIKLCCSKKNKEHKQKNNKELMRAINTFNDMLNNFNHTLSEQMRFQTENNKKCSNSSLSLTPIKNNNTHNDLYNKNCYIHTEDNSCRNLHKDM